MPKANNKVAMSNGVQLQEYFTVIQIFYMVFLCFFNVFIDFKKPTQCDHVQTRIFNLYTNWAY